jgi:hypothetical protein
LRSGFGLLAGFEVALILNSRLGGLVICIEIAVFLWGVYLGFYLLAILI